MPRPAPAKPKNPNESLWAAVKKAFAYRWNLLVFGGGAAAAVISGQPDIILPLVAAAELAYLGSMVSFPKFRQAVAREGYVSPNFPVEGQKEADPSVTLANMVTGLPPESRKRFDLLRARCLEMREISQGVRGRTGEHAGEGLHTPALDRLLWVFLRLLISQSSLKRFLAATPHGEMEKRVDELKARLAAVQAQPEAERDERLLRSLADSVAVAELRLDNYRKAQANAEFVQIELDRIEAKIQALTEMAVNRQDPDYLSSQVDAAAASMTQTESAITELQTLTGLVDDLEAPPPILETSMSARQYDVA